MSEKTFVVLGATSQIAQDFIVQAHHADGVNFNLFARRPEAVSEFLSGNDLPEHWSVGPLSRFEDLSDRLGASDGIINFVGVGDPAKAKEMGAAIFDATLDSDRLARSFISKRPGTPYVFLSSGAVYGAGFLAPADADTSSSLPVNALEPQHYYSVSKLHAEAMHRASSGSTILDLRIFNYFSRTIDLSARYLITDMLRCVVEGKTFTTTDSAMTRDYIHPADLRALIMLLLAAPAGTNLPVDAFSAGPISKAELVCLFRREFGLETKIVASAETINATGAKPEYYSVNSAASELGYKPRFTSAESVVLEAKAALAGTPRR